MKQMDPQLLPCDSLSELMVVLVDVFHNVSTFGITIVSYIDFIRN